MKQSTNTSSTHSSPKTFNKLSDDDRRVLQAKSAIAFNNRIFDDIMRVIYSSVSDIDVLIYVCDALENFVDTLDNETYKRLHHENSNKENLD